MFDPYHKWLGIPPKDQPPNHYRLLGLELFESDPDVIDGAANRQMGYIQQWAAGEHMALSQKLLNELTAARLCLLDPQTRPAYDAQLKAKTVALTAAPREPEPPNAIVVADDPIRPSAQRRPRVAEAVAVAEVAVKRPTRKKIEIVPAIIVDDDPVPPAFPEAIPADDESASPVLLEAIPIDDDPIWPVLPVATAMGRGRTRNIAGTQPGLVRRFDRLLAEVAGPENTILHNFLRALVVMVLVLLAIIFVAILLR